MAHKVVLRAKKNLSLLDLITLSINETNTYNIKFCPRAKCLGPKTHSLIWGLRSIYVFQTDASIHSEAPVLVLGCMAGDTDWSYHITEMGSSRSLEQQVDGLPPPAHGWQAGQSRVFFKQTAGSTRLTQALVAEQETSLQQKRFLQRNKS